MLAHIDDVLGKVPYLFELIRSLIIILKRNSVLKAAARCHKLVKF